MKRENEWCSTSGRLKAAATRAEEREERERGKAEREFSVLIFEESIAGSG